MPTCCWAKAGRECERQSESASAQGRCHVYNKPQPYLELHVKVLLSQSEDADSSFRPDIQTRRSRQALTIP